MTETEYLSFQQCRLANFLSKGKQVLGDWLRLSLSNIDRKNLELFAYLLRVLLTDILDTAVRAKSPINDRCLHPIAEALSVEDYHDAVEEV